MWEPVTGLSAYIILPAADHKHLARIPWLLPLVKGGGGGFPEALRPGGSMETTPYVLFMLSRSIEAPAERKQNPSGILGNRREPGSEAVREGDIPGYMELQDRTET